MADGFETNELILVRNMYSLVLSYCIFSVKGGWHQLEDTTNFLLLKIEQVEILSLQFRNFFNLLTLQIA